jgi:hypothetical protein
MNYELLLAVRCAPLRLSVSAVAFREGGAVKKKQRSATRIILSIKVPACKSYEVRPVWARGMAAAMLTEGDVAGN